MSPDALALVRFGLRSADDRRIVNTVKVIDGLLRVETSRGPCFRRYNGDGYGEHDDGSAFDGTGVGRLWPLLTAERAHYELAAGRILRVECWRPAIVHWSADGWFRVHDEPTRDSGVGVHFADLPTADLAAGEDLVFTRRSTQTERWEGQDHRVHLDAAPGSPLAAR